ncbi:hypothetical protein [Furfurilactobacillus milii]|uniref:AbrB family transcriptional regulator n=1 Tax=Furfurilactobacillus rossiae TaxID=231049 RepID=A0A7C9N4L0_9LACO|nr:hypothetical protein [Furfurilactobacillus milii]MYV05829.1 hypothetical protein [Furfurilactobacillus milii]
MIIKSRKVGNSITLTLPEELNVPGNVEFEPIVDSKGNVFLKRISELNEERVRDIHQFMDQFKPLMDKLKDK